MEFQVLSTGIPHESLPLTYIRPESDRPRLAEVSQIDNVPVIDLACENRALIVDQIRHACSTFGFFQVPKSSNNISIFYKVLVLTEFGSGILKVVNHGVEKKVYEEMLEVGSEFFELPVEEKMKIYSDDPTKTMRLSTSFNVRKEKVHNWRDYLRLHCYPIELYVNEWPEKPAKFRYYSVLFNALLLRFCSVF